MRILTIFLGQLHGKKLRGERRNQECFRTKCRKLLSVCVLALERVQNPMVVHKVGVAQLFLTLPFFISLWDLFLVVYGLCFSPFITCILFAAKIMCLKVKKQKEAGDRQAAFLLSSGNDYCLLNMWPTLASCKAGIFAAGNQTTTTKNVALLTTSCEWAVGSVAAHLDSSIRRATPGPWWLSGVCVNLNSSLLTCWGLC